MRGDAVRRGLAAAATAAVVAFAAGACGAGGGAPGAEADEAAVERSDEAAPAATDPAGGATEAPMTDAAAPGPTPARPDAPAPRDGQPAAQPAGEVLTGQLEISGAQPMTFVVLHPEGGGRSVQLLGSHEPELRRLAGAVVRVEGTRATGRLPGGALAVRTYEVVSVDGQPAYVGVLESAGGELRLAGPRTLRLVDTPAGLAERAGATIWVTGPRDGDAVRLQSWGVIRP